MLTLTAACVLVVLVAVWARISAGWPERIGVRGSAALASIGAPVALLIWLPAGPLAPGWAKRAGTPTSLLPAASARAVSTSRTTAAGTSMSAGLGSVTARRFTAQLTGSVSGAMTLLARLQISRTGATATGALTASPQPVSVTPHARNGRDSDSDGGE